MRILFCLALSLALIGPAQAEHPQRLSDRSALSIKLVSTPGWRLSAVATTDVQNGIEVFVIKGDVFNVSDKERPSPIIRLAVLGQVGSEIYHWTVLADAERIAPGDYAPFNARIENPPQDAESVKIIALEAEVPLD